MRFIGIIICSIISFFYWLSNLNLRKIKDDETLQNLFTTACHRLKHFLISLDRAIEDALPPPPPPEPSSSPSNGKSGSSSRRRGSKSSPVPLSVHRKTTKNPKQTKALQKMSPVIESSKPPPRPSPIPKKTMLVAPVILMEKKKRLNQDSATALYY